VTESVSILCSLDTPIKMWGSCDLPTAIFLFKNTETLQVNYQPLTQDSRGLPPPQIQAYFWVFWIKLGHCQTPICANVNFKCI
jgi:hypothetical protein